jgi:hypothetical protein
MRVNERQRNTCDILLKLLVAGVICLEKIPPIILRKSSLNHTVVRHFESYSFSMTA